MCNSVEGVCNVALMENLLGLQDKIKTTRQAILSEEHTKSAYILHHF